MLWKIIDGKLVKLDAEGNHIESKDLVTILSSEQLGELDPTESQLEAMIADAALEVDAQKAGDKTAKAAKRIRDLVAYRNMLVELINEIRTPAPEAAEVQPPVVEVEQVVEQAAAEASPASTDAEVVQEVQDEVAVAEDAPVAVAANIEPDDGGQSIAPSEVTVKPTPIEASGTDWNDLTGQKALAAMRAGLDEGVLADMTNKPHMHGLPVRASLGPGQGYSDFTADWSTLAMKQANRFMGSQGALTDGAPLYEWNPLLASLDPRTGKPLAKFGRNPDENQRMLQDPEYMAMAEALFADFCGVPAIDRARVEPCGVRTDEPIIGAMRTPVPIGNGKISFYQDIYDITMLGGVLPQLWFEADQNAVDPNDRATWKGCATLPDCNNQVDVTAYMLPTCLRVCLEDEISRPEVIEQANLILRVLQARLAESYRLDVIDAYTGVNGHIYNADFSSTGYGAALEFHNQLCRVVIGLAEFNRKDLSTFDVIVPAHFVKLLWLDEVNAGANRQTLPGIVEWMEREVAAAGFRQLVITPDYGSAEGALFGALAPGGSPGQAAGDPYVQPVPTYAAGSSVDAVPALPTTATIRITDLQEFQPGLNTAVAYELRRSPDLLRQNCAEFFGESAHMLYKKGCAETFRLDITNICVNGARPDAVTPFTC